MAELTGRIPIAFLITGLGVGGAETQLVRLVTNLDPSRWQPLVISMLPVQAFTEQLEAAGVPLVSLGMTRGLPSLRAFLITVRVLRQFDAAVLVCFMFHANLLGRIAGRVAGVPVIVSSVRTQFMGSRWRDLLLRYTDWLGDMTTSNSRLVADQLVQRGVVPSDRLQVIPNAVSSDAFISQVCARPRVRESLGLAGAEFLWLAVGRLDAAKDYPTLLRAFATVAARHSACQLTIAGQGPLMDSIQQLSAELGISRRVSFLGVRNDVRDLLEAADGFVLSSAYEGFPNVIMEAMAAGKAVVATRVGGVPELVEDEQSGFIVPPGDAAGLAKGMLHLMSLSSERRRSLGIAAQDRMKKGYSNQYVVGLWDRLCTNLLEEKLGKDLPRGCKSRQS